MEQAGWQILRIYYDMPLAVEETQKIVKQV
jgi:hypothetical protein